MNEKLFDPRMHSVEHIINQTMIRMFGCKRCFSAHIEKKKSKVDYHFERNLQAIEVEQLQNRVNKIIEADLPVWEEFISRHEAERALQSGSVAGDGRRDNSHSQDRRL